MGLTEAQAYAQGDCIVAQLPYGEMDRAVIDDRTEGFCKLIVSKETHRLLGAQVVGEQAVEIIQLVAAGMAADMKVEQLADLEMAYPTYSAILGRGAAGVPGVGRCAACCDRQCRSKRGRTAWPGTIQPAVGRFESPR